MKPLKFPVAPAVTLTVALAVALAGCNPDGVVELTKHLDTPAPLQLPPPHGLDAPFHPQLDHRLNLVHWRFVHQGEAAARVLAVSLGLDLAPAGVLVQINRATGASLDQITDAALLDAGALPTVRGTTVMEARAPVDRLAALAERLPAVGSLEVPALSQPEVGRFTSQGVSHTFADRLHCRGITGKGIHVGVEDIGFSYWSSAESKGELPVNTGNPNYANSYHGTACAEVVADMAPGAKITALTHTTLAKMQSFVDKDLQNSGINIITRSLSSTGGGFGGSTGAWCDLVKKAANLGVAWINSAGNYGGGAFWRGKFSDPDGDGWHDFAPGIEVNKFSFTSARQISVYLDWDDYPASSEDYDLYIYRLDGTKWIQYSSHKSAQTGTQEPREYLKTKTAPAGTYGVAIFKKKASKSGMTFRAFKYHGGSDLAYYQAAGSLNTVAACPDVISVAAVPQAQYVTGPQSSTSSQGPTWDGRTKPDIAAPTYVTTSVKSSFSGTSAAAPHVAGAVALYMEATGKSALDAARLVLHDSVPMGHPSPNNIYGDGRLSLDAKRVGWQCALNQDGPCTTSCGSTGQTTCAGGCLWGTCVPPAETCNGKDDDCDGQKDEDLPGCVPPADLGPDLGPDSALADAGSDGGQGPDPEEGSCNCATSDSTRAPSWIILIGLLWAVGRRRP